MPARRRYASKRKRYSRTSSQIGKQAYFDKLSGSVTQRPNFLRKQAGEPEPSTIDEWNATQFGLSAARSTDAQKYARQMHGYKGRGRYSFGKSLRALGGYTKSVGKIAKTAGGILKRGASDYASASLAMAGIGEQGLYGGQGEYAMNQLMEGGAPSLQIHEQLDETDDISFTQEEYVRPIYAPFIAAGTTSSFNSQIIECNPGLTNFAPKLAALSANFTHYQIHQLIFTYRTKINESNVNNGIAGDVMMTFNYDPVNDSYDSVGDVMQSSGRVMARIVDSIQLGVECADSKSKDTKYFVRTCPVPLGRDVDEFDHGNLLVATNNIPSTYSNTAIGDLYCYYTVSLKQFKPGASKINSQQRDLFINNFNVIEASHIFGSGVGSQISLATLRAQQSNIGGMLTSDAGGAQDIKYTFPADVEGFFEITFMLEGTGLTFIAANATTTGNVTLISDIYAGGGAGDAPGSYTTAFSSTRHIVIAHVRVRTSTTSIVNNAMDLTFADTGLTGTVTAWSYEVKEMSQNNWQSRKIQIPKFVNDATGIETTP